MNHSVVANGSFENPDVSSEPGGYQYNPTDTTWSYLGDAGLASNGSDLTSSNPDAPDGRQVAFIQKAGVISEIRTVTAGTYTLAFYAAQRDGNTMDQQVRVNLRPSGAGVSVKRFVWCGSQICEERDSGGGTVTKRFFAEGETRIGGSDAGNYYYSRDHLGSIREITDSSGRLKARYDYDPYGKSVVVDGNMNVDFGYTGHYFHAPSGLNLSLYRAYNPALGRWLSRDPIGEAGGTNLYGYVGNNSINASDLFGLFSYLLTFGPGSKGIPHTAVWIVDSHGSTFYSFDSAGLHRINNPSSFLSDEGIEQRSLEIDRLDPSTVDDQRLRDFYESKIADAARYFNAGQVCNTQARDAIEYATLRSDAPYTPTDIAFTPGFLRIDLIRQDFINPEMAYHLGRRDQ